MDYFKTNSVQLYLRNLSTARTNGVHAGIYSVCSAHPWVLEAGLQHGRTSQIPVLLEATCNQVNQHGGYTGMTPLQFRETVEAIAQKTGFPLKNLILGGDHLGPFPWRHLSAEQAMDNAREMVRQYVQSGFRKIHLDTSMPCAGDPLVLPDEVIAERAAQLCMVAEASKGVIEPLYVIGTEVPTPGGAGEEIELTVTTATAANQAIDAHETAFLAAGLHEAWDRVIALVVQPGVEFSNDDVVDYVPEKARPLVTMLQEHPSLVFEAHSTDFQLPSAYTSLVRDGFSILKVGPQLTYAMRQAIFALAHIEAEVISEKHRSRLRAVLESEMLDAPKDWLGHYHGDPIQSKHMRGHSYSDRIRYYWNAPVVQQATSKLIGNLTQVGIPNSILSDLMPDQYRKVRERRLEPVPSALIFDKIASVLDVYQAACV